MHLNFPSHPFSMSTHASSLHLLEPETPPRKRRLVKYQMQPLSEQLGFTGLHRCGHRFGVNRILRVGASDILSAGRDGVIRRWDVSESLQMSGTLEHDRGDREAGLGQIQSSPKCTGTFTSHTDWVTSLAVASERIMASGSNDGTIKLWDLASVPNYLNGHQDDTGGVGNCTSTGTNGGSSERRGGGNLPNGNSYGKKDRTGSSRNYAHSSGGVGELLHGALMLNSNGSSNGGGFGEGEDSPPHPPAQFAPLLTVSGHGDYVKCLAYSPHRSLLVSGGLDKRMLVWDLQRMTAPLMSLLPTGRGDEKGVMGKGQWKGLEGEHGDTWQLLRDPRRVLLGPGIAATGHGEVFELFRQNKGSVYCVDIDTQGTLVASGGTDRMIRLLDPRGEANGGGKICKLDGHGDNVRCVRIDEGGTRVVSGSSDGTLRVWDVRQQCCLGVYELPAGSVWAIHPSPCDSDVYYSGGLGRRVFRTDFTTGCSSLVCVAKAEVLDLSIECVRGQEKVTSVESGNDNGMSHKPLAMWLSCTRPEVSLWGCGKQGERLRTGSAVGEFVREGGVEGSSMALLKEPYMVIPGQPGVVRHHFLNNRRHVLTEDDASPPNIGLWDVTKGKQVEEYPPGTMMEEKAKELLELIAVRPWFSVDTHLGTPVVSLSETNAFDGELYAVDASRDHNPPHSRSPTGHGEGGGGCHGEDENGHRSGGGSGEGQSKRGRGNGGALVRSSAHSEVKVNLGEGVLRGLFSRWRERRLQLVAGGD
ncbi:unnamed protein product, partial [Choristocarpus tenellus]